MRMDSQEITIVKAFIAAINGGDASSLSGLMTDDHSLVDSGGSVVSGRARVTDGWKTFFSLFPDYRVEAEFVLQNGAMVAVFGSASGTYNGKRGLVPENKIAMPAAWKAVVEKGKVKLWQVYADWTEGSKVIEEDGKT
jgi:ketosteroid isomerase-like protein